jgi:NAD(P)-dependent dehydrogenase (short-subunit alcohol dehydrogenase family)
MWNEENPVRSLEGKAVIVTGAGQGLGRAFALRAAAQGASVVVNDLSAKAARAVAAEIEAAGGRAIGLAGSVARWATSEALVAAALGTFGRLDGLVNNAGVHYIERPWNETERQVRGLIEVNVLGTLYCGIQALKVMRDQGHGSIVNVTSGAQMGMDLRATYGASKGAVASATYGWALETLGTGIRVNAISPLAYTPMAQEADDDLVRFALKPGAAAAMPRAEEIAPMVCYLLSDLATGVTGQVVRSTGRTINILDHPDSRAPFVEAPAWDEGGIAAAFDQTLRAAMKPVGFQRPA